MKEAEKNRIIKRYNDRFSEVGLNRDGLAVGPEERHNLRFKILAESGIQSGDSVLDLGCGFGDLLVYLQRIGLKVIYTGYDINPVVINEARNRHPSHDFQVLDILDEDFPVFDFIVSSTSFNLPLLERDNYAFVGELLEKCHHHARKAVSIDFLSSYCDYPSAEGFHYEPEKIFALAKKITKSVILRHDYHLYEFNIVLFQDWSGWGNRADMP